MSREPLRSYLLKTGELISKFSGWSKKTRLILKTISLHAETLMYWPYRIVNVNSTEHGGLEGRVKRELPDLISSNRNSTPYHNDL